MSCYWGRKVKCWLLGICLVVSEGHIFLLLARWDQQDIKVAVMATITTTLYLISQFRQRNGWPIVFLNGGVKRFRLILLFSSCGDKSGQSRRNRVIWSSCQFCEERRGCDQFIRLAIYEGRRKRVVVVVVRWWWSWWWWYHLFLVLGVIWITIFSRNYCGTSAVSKRRREVTLHVYIPSSGQLSRDDMVIWERSHYKSQWRFWRPVLALNYCGTRCTQVNGE